MKKLTFIFIFFIITDLSFSLDFDHIHSSLDIILKTHVQNGSVNYSTLQKDSSQLTQYLDQIALVSKDQFDQWNKAQQLAFLINLYNAQTLSLIVQHYPVNSIKDIKEWFKGPWDIRCVRLFGKIITLNQLEHEIIRKNYQEPRVHFALVRAARSCPPLRPESFNYLELNEQLENQGKLFFIQEKKNRIDHDSKTIYLSPIFKWFKEDFKSLKQFAIHYFSEELTEDIENYNIKYTRYDWSLNEIKS